MKEIGKIEKEIKKDFFNDVFYMDQDKKHPLKHKTAHRMPAYREFIKRLNKDMQMVLPEPHRPTKYKSQEPMVIVSPHPQIGN